MKKQLTIPIYNIPLFITDDLDKLVKRIRKDVPDYNNEKNCNGRCSAWGNTDNELKLGIYAKTIPNIAHEAVHAANEVFDAIGQSHSVNNDECFAYLVEWIVKEFIEAGEECKCK